MQGKQPDGRLRRHRLGKLEENRLKLHIAGSQSAIMQDEATGQIVAIVYRNFMPANYHSLLNGLTKLLWRVVLEREVQE